MGLAARAVVHGFGSLAPCSHWRTAQHPARRQPAPAPAIGGWAGPQRHPTLWPPHHAPSQPV